MGVNHDLGSLVPEQLSASCCTGNWASTSELSSDGLKLSQKQQSHAPCACCRNWVQILPLPPNGSDYRPAMMKLLGLSFLTCQTLVTYPPRRFVVRWVLNNTHAWLVITHKVLSSPCCCMITIEYRMSLSRLLSGVSVLSFCYKRSPRSTQPLCSPT